MHLLNPFDSVTRLSLSRSSSASSQPPSPQPWEEWEFDETFLAALRDWDAKNPETTLQRIFQNASLAIDQGKDIVDALPDTPFPARGLVLSVLQLVRLGATISEAQPELVAFAREIIDWVDSIKSSFANTNGGQLTKATWNNLARIRKLIDEICSWATRRLQDNRWSIKNVKISREIADFKTRLNDTNKIFQNRSIIVISGGLDAILQKLGTLLNSFDRISRTLKDIQNIQEEHQKVFNKFRCRQETMKEVFGSLTAGNVRYDQQEKIPCDDDTRQEVLAEIRAWVDEISYGSKNFLWLTGDPGCGKSAVTASVARECKDRKILRAQFFINRNNDETTNPNLYFPTLARQLAEYSDTVERQIFDTLRERSSLLDRISHEQVTKFFLDVLGAAAIVDSKVPVVVVIDGLDETRRDKLEETAMIFSTLFYTLPSYPNIKIFISSRTEHEIQNAFSRALRSKRIKNIYLDTNSASSIHDVETYLRKKFHRVAVKAQYNPKEWPGEERLRSLAHHASGHFIWAVTVTKFLEEQLDEWGLERLDTVMGNLGITEGRQDIKGLYGAILRLTYQRKNTDPWAFETFRRVVGAVVTSFEPLSLNQLEVLLDLRQRPHSPPVDLLHFVRRLRTVLVAGTGDITGETMLRLHKSFFEYITSDDCDVCFRVSLEASNTELALQCLRHITQAYSDIRNAHSVISTTAPLPNSSQVRYSLRFCASHFPKRGEKPLSTVIDDPAVDPLQLNAIIHRSPGVDGCPGPLTLRYMADSMLTSLDDRGIRWRSRDHWLSPEIPPSLESRREILCSQISPMETKIAVAFASLLPHGYQSEVEVFDAENLHLYCVPLTYKARSLVFSPDGKHIAVLTTDSIVQIHVDTGKVTIENPRVRLDMDLCLIFSPDGVLHQISNTSPSVLIRSRIDGSPKTVEMPHGAECKFMAVSRDCTQIITITQDGTHVWGFDTGDVVHTFPSDFDIWCAAISPNKEIVICSDSLGTVYMRQINVSQSWKKLCDINTLLHGGHGRYFTREMVAWLHSGIDHLNFSADGDLVVATSHGIAQLVDVRNGRSSILYNYCELRSRFSHHDIDGEGEVQSIQCPIFSLDGKHVFTFDKYRIVKHLLPSHQLETIPLQVVEWSSFSPDGNFLISAVLKGGLRLCDLRTGKTESLPFPEGKADVRIACAAISPDGSCIAGISVVGDVYMWDIAHHSILGVSTQPIMDVGSILFGIYGEIILLASRANTIAARLTLVNGILVSLVAGGSVADLPDGHDDHDVGLLRWSARIRYFDADTAGHTYSPDTAPNSRLKKVRWFSGPSNDSDVFYAYVNNHIVRGGADGTFVVVPVTAQQHAQ
ncbi:hypothetical protein C0993_004528 [Termitomyces sp. T159_Od127]|nr:hypothetical protein C0993_004528 [Termitomyces sp. T159_Od127]